jgi:transposase InsO family protein
MKAVLAVRRGWSMRKAARHFGFSHGAIINWIKKAPPDGRMAILTKSSRPHTHPRALPRAMVAAIIAERKKRGRCAEVVHQELVLKNITTSLSSVKRTLRRSWLLKERSPWKRYHISGPRPHAEKPGDLVQIDTIHIMTRKGERFYIYTLIDVHSRWAYAKVVSRISTHASLRFVREAQKHAVFQFHMLQSDHGPEFSSWFTERVAVLGMRHRHSRVRQANDNAHIERFNRTIQDECLRKMPALPAWYQRAIDEYLPYYNGERLHLGLQLKTPLQVVTSY